MVCEIVKEIEKTYVYHSIKSFLASESIRMLEFMEQRAYSVIEQVFLRNTIE